jgi:hypothetical protein
VRIARRSRAWISAERVVRGSSATGWTSFMGWFYQLLVTTSSLGA